MKTAHTTPPPGEDLAYQEYLANGGKLNYDDWLAAGKPLNRAVRVIPEGDQYDAAKQRELKKKGSEGNFNKPAP